MERQPLEELVAAFTRKSLSSGIQLWKTLIAGDYTFEELDEWLKADKQFSDVPFNTKKGFIRKPSKICPKCEGLLKATAKDKGILWAHCGGCSRNSCNYTEYIDKPIEEIIGMEA